MELRLAVHSVSQTQIVEVFDNSGRFVAAIYPDDEHNGFKIFSKYIPADGLQTARIVFDPGDPPGILITFPKA